MVCLFYDILKLTRFLKLSFFCYLHSNQLSNESLKGTSNDRVFFKKKKRQTLFLLLVIDAEYVSF